MMTPSGNGIHEVMNTLTYFFLVGFHTSFVGNYWCIKYDHFSGRGFLCFGAEQGFIVGMGNHFDAVVQVEFKKVRHAYILPRFAIKSDQNY